MKFWSVFGVMISMSLLAQDMTTNAPPAAPGETSAAAPAMAAPAGAPEASPGPAFTNLPAVKHPATKAAPKRAARRTVVTESKTVPLTAGPAVVVANHVNVRGKAGFKGEVLTRLSNGHPVTVLEEVHLKRSGPEEPSAWAKIALPAEAHAWVYASYIEATNKTVIARRLNIRGGPGENYSILGRLDQGETVKEIRTKGKWMEIESPTNAYAFMAAEYLSQEPSALAAVAPTAPATAVAAEPSVAEAATNAPVVPETATETNALAMAGTTNEMTGAGTNELAEAETNEMTEAETNEVAEATPPPPRIVEREGVVRYTFSIQAPTAFELISPDNHHAIDYLYTTSTNLDLNRYKGLRIIVTGEEGLDERWKNTPVLKIQRIQVID